MSVDTRINGLYKRRSVLAAWAATTTDDAIYRGDCRESAASSSSSQEQAVNVIDVRLKWLLHWSRSQVRASQSIPSWLQYAQCQYNKLPKLKCFPCSTYTKSIATFLVITLFCLSVLITAAKPWYVFAFVGLSAGRIIQKVMKLFWRDGMCDYQ